jgi:F-type H+-transporting ATPase subunit c
MTQSYKTNTGFMGSVGIGIVFGAYLNALARNPSLKGELFATMLLGFALSEATALFALLMAFLLLFCVLNLVKYLHTLIPKI